MCTQDILIQRSQHLQIGTFEHHASRKLYGFEHVAGLLIGYDGCWHLKATASNAYANSKWPEVWAGKFACDRGVFQMTVEMGEEEMAKRASILANMILEHRFWEFKADIKAS